MDWERAIKAEREMLKRVLALYLGLAVLCDRICRRSRPVRCLVLWFLRRAETQALERIAADVSPSLYWSLACHRGDSLAEARRLARCFRAAARLVKRELKSLVRCHPRHAEDDSDRLPIPSRSPRTRSIVTRLSALLRRFCAPPALAARLDTS